MDAAGFATVSTGAAFRAKAPVLAGAAAIAAGAVVRKSKPGEAPMTIMESSAGW